MKKIVFLLAFQFLLSHLVNCQTDSCICKIKNASYTGLYKGTENKLTPGDIWQDLRCANKFRVEKYAKGFVTVCGSSRITENNKESDDNIRQSNNGLYFNIKMFAYLWTIKHGKQYPILTGGGPGLMGAANRGAYDAGGPSIGYSTYYGEVARALPDGNQDSVFFRYNGQDVITDGLIFTSVAMREYMIIMHSAAVVFAPGGTGTEWELFQTIETLKSTQLDPIPIIIFGNKEIFWKSFTERINDMDKRGTINAKDIIDRIEFIQCVDELISYLENHLML
jgi:predicted Rossmann-fold nucleotide-binding protein